MPEYNYELQCWTIDGVVQKCGHPDDNCGCYGKDHAGEKLATQE